MTELVVVGVSSFDACLPMVRWAAGEAADRGAELRLVTAQPARALPDQYLPSEPADAHREAALRHLADMAALVAAGGRSWWCARNP